MTTGDVLKEYRDLQRRAEATGMLAASFLADGEKEKAKIVLDQLDRIEGQRSEILAQAEATRLEAAKDYHQATRLVQELARLEKKQLDRMIAATA